MVNRPACFSCGHRPPAAVLEAAQAQLDADHRLMETDPASADGGTVRKQRLLAGLTLRQAAKLLAITPVELSNYEAGRAPIGAQVGAKMSDVYGCG